MSDARALLDAVDQITATAVRAAAGGPAVSALVLGLVRDLVRLLRPDLVIVEAAPDAVVTIREEP